MSTIASDGRGRLVVVVAQIVVECYSRREGNTSDVEICLRFALLSQIHRYYNQTHGTTTTAEKAPILSDQEGLLGV